MARKHPFRFIEEDDDFKNEKKTPEWILENSIKRKNTHNFFEEGVHSRLNRPLLMACRFDPPKEEIKTEYAILGYKKYNHYLFRKRQREIYRKCMIRIFRKLPSDVIRYFLPYLIASEHYHPIFETFGQRFTAQIDQLIPYHKVVVYWAQHIKKVDILEESGAREYDNLYEAKYLPAANMKKPITFFKREKIQDQLGAGHCFYYNHRVIRMSKLLLCEWLKNFAERISKVGVEKINPICSKIKEPRTKIVIIDHKHGVKVENEYFPLPTKHYYFLSSLVKIPL